MNLVFFRTNPQFVKERFTSEEKYCAFWYKEGLSSLVGIEHVIHVDKIFVERTIFEYFTMEYAALVDKFPIEVFEGRTSSERSSKLVFFASSDTIVYLFKNILSKLSIRSYSFFFKRYERAPEANDSLKLTGQQINFCIPKMATTPLLVLGNDWGLIEQKLNYASLRKKLNTVCIQESVIDFTESQGRMRHCSFPIFQGLATLKNINLDNLICAVIGNPRYEDLRSVDAEKVKAQTILINVNFTYDVHEDAREGFVHDILNVANDLKLPYIISQHPRDTGDFQGYNLLRTNAGTVHDELKKAGVLVTRFSSLIHESLCLGVPVIYYNPHGESIFYDFEPDNCILHYATSVEELRDAIIKCENLQVDDFNANVQKYLRRHIGMAQSGESSTFIIDCLNDVTTYPSLKGGRFLYSLNLSLRVLKRLIFNQKV